MLSEYNNGQCAYVHLWEAVFWGNGDVPQAPVDKCRCSISLVYTANHAYYLPSVQTEQVTVTGTPANFSINLGIDWQELTDHLLKEKKVI